MTPEHQVPIGKCACGHSRAAHQTRLGGCGFCRCLQFQLDDVVHEVRPLPKARPAGLNPAGPATRSQVQTPRARPSRLLAATRRLRDAYFPVSLRKSWRRSKSG